MLRNVIDDYLESVSEIEFFVLFPAILYQKGFSDIHYTHGPAEYGKDFIAKKDGIQFIFQLKAGDIDSSSFRNSVQNQLFQAVSNPISHPSLDAGLPRQVILVVTGTLNSLTQGAVSGANLYVKDVLKGKPFEVWDRETLLQTIYHENFSKYFESYFSPAEVSHFLTSFASFQTEDVTSFQIEAITENWASRVDQGIGKIRPFVEAALFDQKIIARSDFYGSALLLASLYRSVRVKGLGRELEDMVLFELKNRISRFADFFFDASRSEEDRARTGVGTVPMFSHARQCVQVAEVLSLSILLGFEHKNTVERLCHLIASEPAVSCPFSDNFAVAVGLTLFALLKAERVSEAKTYLTRCVVWVCDRYEAQGLASLGASEEEEVSQVLSEFLEGLDTRRSSQSFLANILLFVATWIKDTDLLNDTRNDFAACGIILHHVHVLDDQSIWTYRSETIAESFDLEYQEYEGTDYSMHVKYDLKNDEITIGSTDLLISIFLLRDRFYFNAWGRILGTAH